jgi:glutamate-1-semialdehyde aminotransferase
MLDEGVYLPPSGYELWTLCTAFGDTERETVLGAASRFAG